MASVSASARRDCEGRCTRLRAHLADPDFLGNRGLGNEVGIYTFCYDPALELEARDFFARLAAEDLPCRIVEHNLYDILLARLEERRLLGRMDAYERKRGREWIAGQVANLAPASMYAERIASAPRVPGDVILITGVGEVYPFLRLHDLFDSIQPLVGDVPIVAAYPGRFDGRNLQLFSRLEEEHYYRAFDLV